MRVTPTHSLSANDTRSLMSRQGRRFTTNKTPASRRISDSSLFAVAENSFGSHFDVRKVLPVNGRHLVLVPDDEQHAVVGQRRQDVAWQQRRAARHGLHVNDGPCNKNNIINFSPVIKMPRESREPGSQQRKCHARYALQLFRSTDPPTR